MVTIWWWSELVCTSSPSCSFCSCSEESVILPPGVITVDARLSCESLTPVQCGIQLHIRTRSCSLCTLSWFTRLILSCRMSRASHGRTTHMRKTASACLVLPIRASLSVHRAHRRNHGLLVEGPCLGDNGIYSLSSCTSSISIVPLWNSSSNCASTACLVRPEMISPDTLYRVIRLSSFSVSAPAREAKRV